MYPQSTFWSKTKKNSINTPVYPTFAMFGVYDLGRYIEYNKKFEHNLSYFNYTETESLRSLYTRS